MKKYLKMLLAILLTVAVSVGATLAFMTDRDHETNVFTIGNVDIRLQENYRQGTVVFPGVEVTKEVVIENVGTNEAWVWLTCAVPTALVEGTESYLQLNMNGAYLDETFEDPQVLAAYGLSEPVDITQTWHRMPGKTENAFVRDGISYTVFTWLYNGTVAPGKTTNMGLESFCLDPCIDIDPNGSLHLVRDGVDKPVLWNIHQQGDPRLIVGVYAIQKDTFDTVEDACRAFEKQWGLN